MTLGALFTLPGHYRTDQPAHGGAQPSVMPARQPSVLLIASGSVNIELLRPAIGTAGFEVSMAADAGIALGLLARGGYETVVSDTQLPDMSVFELMRKLATLERYKRPDFVIVSANCSVEDVLSSLRLGAVSFLQPPAMTIEIVEAVVAASRRRRERPDRRMLPPIKAARLLLLADEKRNVLFPGAELDQAAWQMMLEIYLAEVAGKTMTITDLSIASGAPNTTALRRLFELTGGGLAMRQPDSKDHRRVLVSLTPSARDRVDQFLDWFGATTSLLGRE